MHLVKFSFFCFLLFVACKEPSKKVLQPKLKAETLLNVNLSSGKIKRVKNFPSKFVRPRNVDIWLPNNYTTKKKYAVLYMHDGQMLFDAETTWNKQEWKVDEILDSLGKTQNIIDLIVVAIWNHPDIRHSDYYPRKPFDALPEKFRDSLMVSAKRENQTLFKDGIKSDNYLKFIVKELKPFIDKNFSVYTNAKNTFIAGSSMGGLISMYALCEYPNIFGGAACLSTHWPGIMPFENNPIPESFFNYMIEKLPSPKNHKIYFDYGTNTLDKFYLPYQHRVDEVLKQKGYNESNFKNLRFEGHDHSENSWNQRFQIPMVFLLKHSK